MIDIKTRLKVLCSTVLGLSLGLIWGGDDVLKSVGSVCVIILVIYLIEESFNHDEREEEA